MADQQNKPVLVATSAESHIEKPPSDYELTPRLKRLARALLDNPAGLSREQVDQVTPCSNGPEYVRQLKYRLGLTLPTKRITFTTVDGVKSWYGRYYLTPTDQERLTAALS